ncbi:MAG TPA: rod shape-determining protein MreC [Candidatus Pullichristensenella excrementigallinarum]|uniref:Cell shape-determining protein MreC n=1 Tax=Candidatus Pullichristensenella excrementigallinarum TaxID=2840907 RepID=A0A9D1IBD1_9FIRM|nr:rod shape-determining protein MreC [Candidatus Pullichristensenella excrementigallinarum]
MAKGAKRAYNKKQVERDRKRRGNRIRRVVFALLALCVVALAFVFLVFRGGSGISMGENAVGSVFAPIQNAFHSASQSIKNFFTNWRDYDDLQSAYDEIYQENQQLSLQLQASEETAAENVRLRELLDAQDRYESLDPIYAKVISRDPGVWFDTFSINKGTADGVSAGMAVVTGDGLVGHVYEAGYTYAKVRTIIDPRSGVACLVGRTRENGVMRGQITENSENADCYVYYLPNTSNIVPGDTIVTSGTDSLYPKGLLIGTVSAVSRETSTEGGYVIVTPSADFQHIEEVLVLRTVVETDQDLPSVPTPTPKPVITPTPNPQELETSAAEPTSDGYWHHPTATPEGGAEAAPQIETLPEDSWVTG